LNICIVGYGSIGRRHHSVLRSLLGSNAIFTIVDIDTETKIEDICKDNFDILVVCTPTSNHLEIASKFSNIKKLIFIEKPLGVNSKNIEDYRDKIDIEKVHVGCNLRFTAPVKKIRKLSKTAKLVNVVSMSYLPNWHHTKNHLESYSANQHLGGGVVLDFIHEPDYISDIFGLPSCSTSTEKRLFNNITKDASDTAIITWEYSDKLINFSLSYGSREFKRFIEIIDENCIIKKIEITRDDIEESYKNQWQQVIEYGPINTYNNAADLQNLLEK
jgi:predicted dehydrogenase